MAAALGKPEEGRELVQRHQGRLRGGRRRPIPSSRARPSPSARTASTTGCLYVYPDGLNTEFLTMLGFTINPKLDAADRARGRAGHRLGRALGRDRRRRDRVRHRAAVGRRRAQEGSDVRQTSGPSRRTGRSTRTARWPGRSTSSARSACRTCWSAWCHSSRRRSRARRRSGCSTPRVDLNQRPRACQRPPACREDPSFRDRRRGVVHEVVVGGSRRRGVGAGGAGRGGRGS